MKKTGSFGVAVQRFPTSITRAHCALWISVCALLSAPALAELPTYQVKDLGTLGGVDARSSDINEAGQVTGSSDRADGVPHAFLYLDGEMRDLGSLSDGYSGGIAINNAGQVTGEAQTTTFAPHAFKYSNGVMQDLGALFQGGSSTGNDINELGQVTGSAGFTPAGEYHAVIFSEGGIQDLGTPGSSSRGSTINDHGDIAGMVEFSQAFVYIGGQMMDPLHGLEGFILGQRTLNNAGQVAGTSAFGERRRGFLFEGFEAVDIGTLGGQRSFGEALNSRGHVTGNAETASGQLHAFIYQYPNSMTDLGALDDSYSVGYAINDSDEVAGASNARAFVYSNGRMVDLGASLANLGFDVIDSVANDINNAGQVIGDYTVSYPVEDEGPFHPPRTRAFIATPIVLLFNRLIGDVKGVGPGKSLVVTLRLAKAFYLQDRKRPTCLALQAFSHEVRALNRKLGQELAEDLLEDAQEIRDAIGCNAP